MVSKANLQQPANNVTNWDNPLNSNFDILTKSLGLVSLVPITTLDVVLTTAQAQSCGVFTSGTLVGARLLLFPVGVVGSWTLYVGSSGALTVGVSNGAGTAAAGATITPPNGQFYTIISDGTNLYYGESNAVRKTGDTMTGTLNLSSNGLNVGSGQLVVTGGNVTTSGQFIASNNVTAYSDARLKDDIKPISGALAKVMDMRGVTFSYKDTGTRSAGVIAQEVQRSLPEVVYEDENGYLHVAYGNMVSVLIEAVKEMAIKIEALEKRK